MVEERFDHHQTRAVLAAIYDDVLAERLALRGRR